MVPNSQLLDQTTIDRIEVELLLPHLSAAHSVEIQISFFKHFEFDRAVSYDADLDYIEIVRSRIAPLLFSPVIFSPPQPDRLALLDVVIVDGIRSGAGNHFVVVIAHEAGAVD